MDSPVYLILLLFSIPTIFGIYNLIHILSYGKLKSSNNIYVLFEIYSVFFLPVAYLIFSDIGTINDCCKNTAVFSPEHRLNIYFLIASSMIAFAASIFREKIYPPLCELFINVFLLIGIVINIVFCLHIHEYQDGWAFWLVGNTPIIIFMLSRLCLNQKILSEHILSNNYQSDGQIGKLCLRILVMDPLLKYPILTVLIIPILISFSLFLILFEQKPDSLIRAFTDTYKHGFSQLDHLCDNVQCGGHFLCSVGANGHKHVVKPIRYGERNGNKIICNRQLLVSNAFEEIVQTKFPRLHNVIRYHYNKVGDAIHKSYDIYSIKWVSDLVYILMKPLEYFFLASIYLLKKRPEDLIAMQYLSKGHSKQIREYVDL